MTAPATARTGGPDIRVAVIDGLVTVIVPLGGTRRTIAEIPVAMLADVTAALAREYDRQLSDLMLKARGGA